MTFHAEESTPVFELLHEDKPMAVRDAALKWVRGDFMPTLAQWALQTTNWVNRDELQINTGAYFRVRLETW